LLNKIKIKLNIIRKRGNGGKCSNSGRAADSEQIYEIIHSKSLEFGVQSKLAQFDYRCSRVQIHLWSDLAEMGSHCLWQRYLTRRVTRPFTSKCLKLKISTSGKRSVRDRDGGKGAQESPESRPGVREKVWASGEERMSRRKTSRS